ncbi:stalk domain-containing protein [Thermoanaerobacterium sp. DL9XJH110]|uniref:copper amine oxidase N-terminal domain-containing protein n=1 Tax=Thermoanaerobacterium sp. DL9XJH110 TaxID=3386643 RepID=UPI003BB5CAC9
MKKLLAVVVAALLIIITAAPAFAGGNGENHGGKEYRNRIESKEKANDKLKVMETQAPGEKIEEDEAENGQREDKGEKEVKLKEKLEEQIGDGEMNQVENQTQNQNDEGEMNQVENQTQNQGDGTQLAIEERLRELKSELKDVYKDKEQRKQILKQIKELKKLIKDDAAGVFVNGKELKSDLPPVIKGGRVLIPVRAVVNALGAQVQWDEQNQIVTIIKDGRTVTLELGSKIAVVDGQEIPLDVPAGVENGRTIVPLRFIAQAFNSTVEWDEETGTVIIEEPEQDQQIESVQ